VGLAGTITTVAAVEIRLTTYDTDRIHHFHLCGAAGDVFRTLIPTSHTTAIHNPGLEKARRRTSSWAALLRAGHARSGAGFDEMIVSRPTPRRTGVSLLE
jgi:exopolyphosphatase/pppGpp-phosphohydrolase